MSICDFITDTDILISSLSMIKSQVLERILCMISAYDQSQVLNLIIIF